MTTKYFCGKCGFMREVKMSSCPVCGSTSIYKDERSEWEVGWT